MPLKAIVEKLDDVDEAHRALYVERDGKIILDLDEGSTREHPFVTALKNALERGKTALAELKTKVDGLEAFKKTVPEEFTPDEWARLKAVDADESDPDKKKRAAEASKVFEQRITKLNTDHAAALKVEQDKVVATTVQMNKLVVGQALEEAMTAVNIKPEFRKAVRALLKDKVKVVAADEVSEVPQAVVETDLDDKMPLARYAESWAQTDEGKIYVGVPVGSGAGDGGDLRKGEKNPWTKDGWNMTEQGRLYRADPVKAERLAKAAGKRIGAVQ
jgi:hypothetical protein